MKTFTEKVQDVVKKIPRGTVLTYAQVAARAGSSRAYRAVGAVMKANYHKDIPCHRVVKSDGSIGDYNRGGASVKIKLLKEEGVIFTKTNKVAFKK